jgi:hypothetical protein
VETEVYKHPIWPRLTAAAAHTETDEVVASEIVPTVPSITTAEFAKATFLGDRAKRLTTGPLEAIALNRVIDALMLKIETDALTLVSSATYSQGGNATVNNLQNLNSVVSAFRARAKSSSMKPVMVNSVSAMRDLGEDLSVSGAALLGGLVGAQLHSAVTGPEQGLFREFGNMMIAETDGVVAGDTTGKANFIVHVGEAEPALVVVFGKEITVEIGRIAERIGEYVVGSVEHGAGIVDPNRLYRFITRA